MLQKLMYLILIISFMTNLFLISIETTIVELPNSSEAFLTKLGFSKAEYKLIPYNNKFIKKF